MSIQSIDAALQEWRQGDFVLGEQWFVYRIDPRQPLAESSKNVEAEESDLIEVETRGLVLVTQTCDIVRSCVSRPFIEVVPLVEVEEDILNEIQRCRRPQYAFIPGASSYCFVADLDRIMTIEKAVIAGWTRQSGCSSDQEHRLLGQALARKRVRFAFPDDFIVWLNKLQKRISKKHSKSSPEGDALRTLREIRVRAAPSWNYPEIELMFWFIREEQETQFQGIEWFTLLDGWLKLIQPAGRFKFVEGQVITLEDMTAKDYVESDPLDLDHLSN
ncbi:MAG: hypothetical protein F6J86_24980 [Symploca sp. SIO1B1]|nr:hypothetical protein [Symploca sp. SIO1C2]NER97062.1 hypothetical protein [Symploca sp. SIO1B1]